MASDGGQIGMKNSQLTRRSFVERSFAFAGPAIVAATALPISAAQTQSGNAQKLNFEVNSGSQTQGFTPDTYMDITAVLEKKKAALFAHVSQDGKAIWRQHHETIAAWRGREAGVGAAEAFVHLSRDSQAGKLPGV